MRTTVDGSCQTIRGNLVAFHGSKMLVHPWCMRSLASKANPQDGFVDTSVKHAVYINAYRKMMRMLADVTCTWVRTH